MSHLIRQFSATGIIACLVLGGMLGMHSIARATPQDDPSQKSKSDDPSKDDPEGSEKKSAAKDEKKPAPVKEVKTIKEMELSEPELKELYRGTRSHRKPIPALLINKRLGRQEPSKEEVRKFDEFKKTQGATPIKPEDMQLIEKVVKNQVYSLTDEDWSKPNSSGRKNRDAIEPILINPGSVNEKFLATYKELLGRFLPDCLDNHLWARVNAMKLLAMMKDEKNIRLFVQQIQDPKQHEGVKFLAIEGLEMLGHKKISQIDLESLAVGTLLGLLDKSDHIEPYTRQAAVRALGAIGRPTRVQLQKDVQVAVALLKILRDPNIRRWDRSEAMVALANLHISPDLDYNFQYVAYEIAQFVADAGVAALQNPATDDLYTHLFFVDASYSLLSEKKPDRQSLEKRAKGHPQASKQGDAAYVKSLGDQVSKLTVIALKAYRAGVPGKSEDVILRVKLVRDGLQREDFKTQVNAFAEFLKNKPPRDKKLTPQTEELGPPPALVGPSAPAKKEADEEKEKTEPAAGATASQPGP